VFPAARLIVHFLPIESDDIYKQSLRESVLSHNARCADASLLRQLEMAITEDMNQVVALHPRNSLRHSWSTLMQTLCDPSPERHNSFLLELIDGAQVHLSGVDQVAHADILHRHADLSERRTFRSAMF
jgi:hypothetical protein